MNDRTEHTKTKCLCEPTETLVFACSGGSNVGQVANDAAKKMTLDGIGKFYCLAGIGGHVSGMIESSRAAKRIIVIDGCPVKCAEKTLAHAGLEPDISVVVTEQGIEKSYDMRVEPEQVQTIVERVKDRFFNH